MKSDPNFMDLHNLYSNITNEYNAPYSPASVDLKVVAKPITSQQTTAFSTKAAASASMIAAMTAAPPKVEMSPSTPRSEITDGFTVIGNTEFI